MDTYPDCKTVVRAIERQSRVLETGVGLHQGSALSPLLFAVIMDILSEHLRAENLWELLFADDPAITADSKEQLQERLCLLNFVSKAHVHSFLKRLSLSEQNAIKISGTRPTHGSSRKRELFDISSLVKQHPNMSSDLQSLRPAAN